MNQREFELPIETQDLPNNKLGNIDKEWSIPKNRMPNDIVNGLVVELDELLKQKQKGDQNLIYKLYDHKFSQVSSTLFQNKMMPEPEELERDYETEFDMNTQVLYREIVFRHYFSKISHKFGPDQARVLCESWENYLELFQIILRDPSKMFSVEDLQLPSAWIFDIIDEFIYQFTLAYKYRSSEIPEEIRSIINFDNFWNLEQVEEQLVKVIEKSGILIQRQDSKKLNFDRKKQILSTFGLYSLVGMVRLSVLKNDFDQALQYVSHIDYDILKELSRAVSSYLTLFQYAAYSYLMKRRYREAVKLLETVINFFYKYQILLKKSSSSDKMEKQAEKCLCLFTVAIYFKQININENISSKMKEIQIGQKKGFSQQQQSDKIWDYFQKILKFESQSFQDILRHSISKMQLLGEGGQVVIPEHLRTDFEEFRKQTEFISILKLYSKLSIQKLISLLQVSEETIRNQIGNFQNLNSDKLQVNNVFEQTVVRNLFNEPIILDININGSEIEIRELQTKKDYKNIYIRNDEICKEVIQNIKTLFSK